MPGCSACTYTHGRDGELVQTLRQNLKRAELASSVGAGVLGGGLTLLFASALKPFALPTLVVRLLGLALLQGNLVGWRGRREGAVQSVMEGAAERGRPKMTIVGSTVVGSLPILWSSGTGARLSSTVLTLVVILAVYSL